MGSRVLAALASTRTAAGELFAHSVHGHCVRGHHSDSESNVGVSSPLKAPLFENELAFRFYHILLICTTTRPRTYERYKEAIDLHIVPALGHYQLQKLTPQRVQAFYAKKRESGLAPATIRYYHSVLHNALGVAVKWGLVARNVCDLAEPPRKERFEMQALTLEQTQMGSSLYPGTGDWTQAW